MKSGMGWMRWGWIWAPTIVGIQIVFRFINRTVEYAGWPVQEAFPREWQFEIQLQHRRIGSVSFMTVWDSQRSVCSVAASFTPSAGEGFVVASFGRLMISVTATSCRKFAGRPRYARLSVRRNPLRVERVTKVPTAA